MHRNADSKTGGACCGAPLRLPDLVRDLLALGVRPGDLLMVHSSLRSIGFVEGGPETVVDALLQAIGPQGTLVVPTFTYPTAGNPEFVFDPAHTPSQMGAISEAARRRPHAHRSIHLAHSIAAIGPLAETIATSGGPSGWDAHSPMRQVFDRNGRYLLLGVPYQNLTAMHLCEVWLELPYRKPRISQGRMRQPDGSIRLSSASAPRRSPATPAATTTASASAWKTPAWSTSAPSATPSPASSTPLTSAPPPATSPATTQTASSSKAPPSPNSPTATQSNRTKANTA